MTQRALAKKAQVTPGYIAQLETGLKKNPSLPVLRRLAKALGVPVKELVGELMTSSATRIRSTPAAREAIIRHVCNVGHLVVSLQSLEFVIRGALAGRETSGERLPGLETLRVGQRVEAGPMTQFASLRTALEKLNRLLLPKKKQLDVDRLVALRDMLAHGRVFSARPMPPFRLLKFGKESNGTVEVEAAITMTDEWFQQQADLIRRAQIVAGDVGAEGAEDGRRPRSRWSPKEA